MNFEKAKNSYRENALVQKKMAANLIKILLKKIPCKSFETVFEIGAGTGFLTDLIREKINYKKIILNDITDNFTNFEPDNFLKGDINEIPLKKESFDLVLSNACIQWISDYPKLFQKIYSSLKNGGFFVFSTFGEKNFIQIKNITGIGLEYPDLSDYIEKSGFRAEYFEQELDTIYFKNPIEVLEHIKYTGTKTKNRAWTKKEFKFFEEQYLKKFEDEMGVELTYHPVYYVLSKKPQPVT